MQRIPQLQPVSHLQIKSIINVYLNNYDTIHSITLRYDSLLGDTSTNAQPTAADTPKPTGKRNLLEIAWSKRHRYKICWHFSC